MKDEYKEILCRVRFIDGVPARTYLSDVEIVRCKDCKHYCNEDEIYISEEGFATTDCIFMPNATDNDFCSRAERKEE